MLDAGPEIPPALDLPTLLPDDHAMPLFLAHAVLELEPEAVGPHEGGRERLLDRALPRALEKDRRGLPRIAIGAASRVGLGHPGQDLLCGQSLRRRIAGADGCRPERTAEDGGQGNEETPAGPAR